MTDPDAGNERTGGHRLNPAALGAAGVVHDVNQMLSVITVRAELLARGVTDRQQRVHLQAILLAAADAGRMLERLGAAAGGASGSSVDAGVSLARAVADASLLVIPPDGGWNERSGTGQGWRLESHIDPVLGMAVPGPVLREVLANLLHNALAAMPGGGVVTIEAIAGADTVALHVRDSGPGLPVAAVEQVFAAGFTTSGSTGRGIGLAACRQLLSAYGATLTAAARGGPGAVFTIAAPPRLTQPETVTAAGPERHAAPVGSRSLPRDLPVVVIDDEPAVREMLTDVLVELGCRVTCHRDGGAALEAGAPGDAAVALVDRRLPGMDGVTLAARLRERRPTLAVIVMTGWDREETAAPPGVADFTVRKPLGMETLLDVLLRAVSLQDDRRQAGDRNPGGS